MLFSSVTFLIFFLPIVLVFYYALPNLTYKNCVLFLGSLLFYAWGEPRFVFLMFASIVFNYNMGLFLGERAVIEPVEMTGAVTSDGFENLNHRYERNRCHPELVSGSAPEIPKQVRNDTQKRKLILAFAVLVNIAVLFVFKYLGFSCKIVNLFLNALHFKPLTALNLVMPIGISFYTFQEISYLVDVYRKPDLAQKNLLNLGLYITFFPQLIAGPIVRYHDINEQIQARVVTVSQFSAGLERFIVGLSKKVLLANSFALVCDSIYGADFFSYGAYTAWVAAFSYAMQIYYDFSGYSDMAIGLAKLFGFTLAENFNYPYAATSITDFWRRWHISLTNFFRDYVYIPLGGNRKVKARTILNRFIIFFTTGLWHGASFNFVLWGLAHGFLMTIERILPERWLSLSKPSEPQANEQGGFESLNHRSEQNRCHPELVSGSATEIPKQVRNDVRRNGGFDRLNHRSEHKLNHRTTLTAYGKILANTLGRIYTLLSVMLLWVLFRNGTKATVKIILKMFGINYSIFTSLVRPFYHDDLFSPAVSTKFYVFAIIGILFSFPWREKFSYVVSKNTSSAFIAQCAKYILLALLLILCYANLAAESYNPFIYFRF